MAISSEDAAMLQGFFEAADAQRIEMERKWGVGRLEALAALHAPVLLARFRGQQARWRAALKDAWEADFLTRDALTLAEQKTGSMQRAWLALDASAEEAGHRAIAPWVWEARLEDGTVAAFVQTDAEASKVIAEGRHVLVYTLDEVAALLQLVPTVLSAAKVEFPGAKLQMPHPYYRSKEPIPWDDPIPFGDAADDDEAPF